VIVIPANIASNVRSVLASLPAGITLVAAAKSRTPDEVRAAIAAGVGQIGHNYVREAEAMLAAFGPDRGGVRWRMIGHLQRNKARDAVRVFDVIDTVGHGSGRSETRLTMFGTSADREWPIDGTNPFPGARTSSNCCRPGLNHARVGLYRRPQYCRAGHGISMAIVR
jgi:hypothetical protein